MTSFADMAVTDREVLIPGQLYYGTACQLVGEGKAGKGRYTRAVGARVSQGWPPPPWDADDPLTPPELFTAPQRVIFASTEDEASPDILPSLIAQGARLELCDDLSNVETTSTSGSTASRKFKMPRDFPFLRDEMDRLGEKKAESDGKCYPVGLVIIDPLMATSERSVAFNQQIRTVLESAQSIAADTGAAFWFVNHISPRGAKGDENLIRRITGSVGIEQALRVTAVMTRDPQNEKIRVVRQLSSNLDEAPPAIRFMIEGKGEDTHLVFEQPSVTQITEAGRQRIQRRVLDELIAEAIATDGPVNARRLVSLTAMSYTLVQQALSTARRQGLVERHHGAWQPMQAIESAS